MTDYDHAAILDRIRTRLPFVGKSATGLSRELGLSDNAVGVWFTRGRMPLDYAPAVATALDCSPAWLLFGQDGGEGAETVADLAREVGRLAEHQAEIAGGLARLRDEREMILQEREQLAHDFASLVDHVERLARVLEQHRGPGVLGEE